MKIIEVVAAVFIRNDKIFCAQRNDSGPLALKWEFPGGKIEINETKEQALIREIKEELDTKIKVNKYLMTVNHDYPTFHITMHAYLCDIISGNLALSEHVNSCWLGITQLQNLDWAEADIPIVEKIIKDFSI